MRRAVLVIAHRKFRAITRLKLRQRGKRHHVPSVIAHVELSELRRVRPVRSLRFHVHLPGTAEIVEVVDKQPAHESLNSLVNIIDCHTLLEDLFLVHLHELLRHARQKGSAQRANFGTLASGRHKLGQIVGQELYVPSCTIFQHELKSTGSADPRNGWRREAESSPLRKLAKLLVQARLDLLILFRSGCAVTPGLESDEIEGVVTGADIAQQTEANHAAVVLNPRSLAQDFLNIPRCFCGPLLRSRVRKLHIDVDISLVFIGQEARGQTAAEENRADAEGRDHHESQRTLPNKTSA